MKRLVALVFSLALIFTLSPLHNIVKAEGNEPTLEIHRNTVFNQQKDDHYLFAVTIMNAIKVEGTWAYYVDGKKMDSGQSDKTTASFTLPIYDEYIQNGELKHHEVKVTFAGKVDGQDRSLEATQSLPDLVFAHKQEANKNTFTGVINAEGNLAGDWEFVIVNAKDNSDVVDKEYSGIKGSSFNYWITTLKEGDYKASLYYEGNVNGEPTVLIKKLAFKVTKDDNGDNNGNNPSGNDSDDDEGDVTPPIEEPTTLPADEPTPPVDHPTTPVDTGDHHANAGAGATLPVTNTSYPIGILAGFILFVIGASYFGYRRFRK